MGCYIMSQNSYLPYIMYLFPNIGYLPWCQNAVKKFFIFIIINAVCNMLLFFAFLQYGAVLIFNYLYNLYCRHTC